MAWEGSYTGSTTVIRETTIELECLKGKYLSSYLFGTLQALIPYILLMVKGSGIKGNLN